MLVGGFLPRGGERGDVRARGWEGVSIETNRCTHEMLLILFKGTQPTHTQSAIKYVVFNKISLM